MSAQQPPDAPARTLKLDSPPLVQWKYASEERLAVRNQTYRDLVEGQDAEEMVFDAVAEPRAERVLEVGSGTGELWDADITEPFRARTSHVVFVARKPT